MPNDHRTKLNEILAFECSHNRFGQIKKRAENLSLFFLSENWIIKQSMIWASSCNKIDSLNYILGSSDSDQIPKSFLNSMTFFLVCTPENFPPVIKNGAVAILPYLVLYLCTKGRVYWSNLVLNAFRSDFTNKSDWDLILLEYSLVPIIKIWCFLIEKLTQKYEVILHCELI